MFTTLLIDETKKLKLPRYEVRDLAPSTLRESIQAYSETGKIIVWAGASDNTIWGAREHNWLFRAWHDLVHIKNLTQFDNAGELRTFQIQASQTESSWLQKLLKIEILGQLEYYNTNGFFPVNQIEFFKGVLNHE